MSLDAEARRRYARQLLLPEVGETGQERLLHAEIAPGAGADERAYAAAADYLRRAGCSETERGRAVPVPGEAEVARFAGEPFLLEPAAAIIGAFCAVEHLKAELGLAEPQPFPGDVGLSEDR